MDQNVTVKPKTKTRLVVGVILGGLAVALLAWGLARIIKDDNGDLGGGGNSNVNISTNHSSNSNI